MKRFIILTKLFVISSLMLGQNTVTGHFVSNFAESGWFSTQLQLKEDQTFKYQFVGDMFYDYAEGTYSIKNDTISLKYYKESPHEGLKSSEDSTVIIPIDNEENTITRPTKFLSKNNKLWKLEDDGQMVKQAYKISKIKHYIFFGENRIRKKKFYLKPVEYEWENW